MLTYHAAENVVSQGIDRRVCPRREVNLKAEALRIANSISAHKQPALYMAVRDLSESGLAAVTDTPIEPGERVALFFPAHMGQRIYDLYGRVIRCEPAGADYRIAVAFDSLAA